VPTRLHPATAVVDTLTYGVQVGSTGFFLGMLAMGADATGVEGVFLLAAVGLVLGAGYGLARWLAFGYAVEDGTLRIVSGVLRRREREIPLGRVQNVDVQRGVLQRLFGLAELRVETAGGSGTEATLAVVSDDEAARLQGRLGGGGDAAVTAPAPDADGAPDQAPLFRLGRRELAAYVLTEFRPGTLLVVVLGGPLVGPVVADLLLAAAAPLGGPERLAWQTLTADEAIALALVSIPAAVVGAWVLGAALAYNGYRGFVLAERGSDLAYRRGLLTEYSGTIPLARVQTVTLRENPLQRVLGFAGLTVDTAGYAGEEAGNSGRRSAVPMADRERALALVRHLEGVDAGRAFTRPPRRARRRYAVRYALAVAAVTAAAYVDARSLGGFSLWWPPALLFAAVPPAAHLTWANRGHVDAGDHLLVQSGFWRRRTVVVPHDRLQTVHRSRTVFQRRRALADVVADTASGAVLRGGGAVVHDLDDGDAAALASRLRAALDDRGG